MKIHCFANKKVALFGLGSSGEATALALQMGGASVFAWDDNAVSVKNAATKGVQTYDLSLVDWHDFVALILSPGIPLTHPEPHWVVKLANTANVEIIGDIELFFRERALVAPHAKCVCITGTNGKSTTTSLIAHMLKYFGQNVQMGGNIGVPVLELEAPNDTTIHVLEISSFQSDLTPSLAPTIGVLLNIAEDHLDRHGSFEAYIKLKKHVVQNAKLAVLGVDDEHTREISMSLQIQHNNHSNQELSVASSHSSLEVSCHKVVEISAARALQNGFSVEGSKIVYASDRVVIEMFELSGNRSLRGAHNAQNAAAALAVVYNLGFTNTNDLQAAIDSFQGLPHRMEEVGQKGKVLFINDSKATNADATQRALASFEPIYWIVGGKDKSDGILSLEKFFPRVKKAYLIGLAAPRFAKTLEDKVPYIITNTVENATKHAFEDAIQDSACEPVVLLSPACASYDQFQNFEHRGNVFREAVQAILSEKLV